MRSFLITIILVLTLFSFILPCVIADDTPSILDTKFIYIIDGTHLSIPSTDMVISSPNLIIVHNYLILNMEYTYENGTVISTKKITSNMIPSNMIQLSIYDKSHLVLTDSQGSIVLDVHLHTMSIENFFKYIVPISFSSLIIPILLAFISAILLVCAFFINKESKIL